MFSFIMSGRSMSVSAMNNLMETVIGLYLYDSVNLGLGVLVIQNDWTIIFYRGSGLLLSSPHGTRGVGGPFSGR